MERPIVAVLRQVIVDQAEAGTGVAAGTEPLAASASGGLGTALLPLFALAAALTAAVCVGSLVVEWLRKPEAGASLAVTDPESAGLLSVGFVSGSASARWLPATVMLLAGSGVIAIQDRRVDPRRRSGSRAGRAPRLRRGLSAGRGVERRLA